LFALYATKYLFILYSIQLHHKYLTQAINKIASFFGDAVLHDLQVQAIIDDLFEEGRQVGEDEDAVVYADQIFKLSVHPLMIEFVSGQGTARYGTVQ
jgi:hypothetical protein